MPATPACILIAEQEVGPYYIDGEALSQNITEGRPGLPLTLRVALVDAKRCSPLSHAAQDIWHCDALGVYCGFTANSPDGRGGPRTSPDADAGCRDFCRLWPFIQVKSPKANGAGLAAGCSAADTLGPVDAGVDGCDSAAGLPAGATGTV